MIGMVRKAGAASLAALVLAPAAAMAAEDPYGEEGGGTLPQLEFDTWAGQIFWLLITFGVLYWVLSRSILPRIGGIIEDRLDKIADDLDDASRFQRQAEEAKESYERTLADARARAHTIAAETRRDVEAAIAEETALAEDEANRRAAAAEERIRAAADEAMANARDIAEGAAAALVEKLVGRAPSPEEAARAVDAALKGEAR